MAESRTHESFERDQTVKGSSDRSFGLVFAAVFTILGFSPLFHGGTLRIWSVVVAAVFLAVALIYPRLLAPLNRLWLKFGLLLHKITNPIIMGAVFFLAVLPTALVLRMLGKDPLRRKLDKSAPSYWILRQPPGPPPDSMKNQF